MANLEIIIGIATGIGTILGTSVVLVLGLMSFRSGIKEDIKELRTEVKEDIKELRTEVKGDIKELRTELKGDIAEVRTELKGDIAEVRTELKGDIKDLRTELKGDIKDLRTEVIGVRMIDSFDEMKTDIKYVREGFAESEQGNKKKSGSRKQIGKTIAKDSFISIGSGFESLGREHIKGKSAVTA